MHKIVRERDAPVSSRHKAAVLSTAMMRSACAVYEFFRNHAHGSSINLSPAPQQRTTGDERVSPGRVQAQAALVGVVVARPRGSSRRKASLGACGVAGAGGTSLISSPRMLPPPPLPSSPPPPASATADDDAAFGISHHGAAGGGAAGCGGRSIAVVAAAVQGQQQERRSRRACAGRPEGRRLRLRGRLRSCCCHW